MENSNVGRNFGECLTVGEAAKYLGVSTATLRNWDRAGTLKPRRHPQNGYRIYIHSELDAVLRSADLTAGSADLVAPSIDWTDASDTDHFVQFYEDDDYLVESVCGYVASALGTGDSSVVIATTEHRNELQRRLVAREIDVANAIESGRYVVLDAGETLSRIMIDGEPSPQGFMSSIGSVFAQLALGGRRINAFGEMVSLLWADGQHDAAIRLEELWNLLGKQYRFSLFCAYPMSGFDSHDHSDAFAGICGNHSKVIPAESYAAIELRDERLRSITALQQKAQSLEAEIEHRSEVEKVLMARERELSDFFENATEGLHKVGPDGTILWANKAEYDLLGYRADEYIGRSIVDFHADPDVIANILETLQRGDALVNAAARLKCKDGSIKHVRINSNACFEEGEFRYTRCFTRDVTDQHIAECALREADRRKDEFLATLAHELRNPLAPIRNCLDMIEVGVDDHAETSEAWRVVDRQVRQLTRLVDDLLDVSRITRDKIQLRIEPVELTTIIQSAVETSRPLLETAQHNLSIKLPPRPIVVNGDPTRLAQIFANLLNNSAKYTHPGGRIEIEAVTDGSNVVVSVHDDGVGISCDELAYVFGMFRQANRSLNRSEGGLGIGLTVVSRLVELHGGTVSAQSEGTGKGSEFTVRLPIASVVPVAPLPLRPAPPDRASEHRIMVVDDNYDAGRTLCLLLRTKGHQVHFARDGFEAIDAVAEFRPNIILMDVGMPKLDGYETTRRIRRLAGGNEIAIFALTGWGQAEDRQRSAEAGCTDHLVKPVELPVLERLLAELTSNAPA